jgi:hypothetical protein
MTFEFMGADLETDEGKQAFARVYDTVMDETKSETDDFLGIDYDGWVQESPDKALEFLAFSEKHISEHMRVHAVSLAIDFMKHQPETALHSLELLLEDDNELVQANAVSHTRDLLTLDIFETERKVLGLMRLSELVGTYNDAKQLVQGPGEN